MPSLGAPEIIVILIIALVVFGPRKLPELGKSIGQGLREFRRSTSAVTDELRREMDTATPAPAVAAAVPAAHVKAASVPEPTLRSE